MCGPSGSQEATANQSQDFSTMLMNNYGTLFNGQQKVLDSIGQSLNPIVAAGPSQQGFSGAELSNLQTQAINNSGAAAKNAEQAARTFGAGEGGGGTSGVTSGITKQIESGIASQQAGNLGAEQTQIQQANYNQGNQNYWRAQGGEQALAGLENPNGAAGSSIAAGNEAFGQETQINTENNAEAQDIAGFATALAGTGASIYKSYQGV
jgi:hypothetical protein